MFQNDMQGVSPCLSSDDCISDEIAADLADPELIYLQAVSSLWFTHISELSTKDTLPGGTLNANFEDPPPQGRGNAQVDDQYLQNISKRLRIASYEPTVPSADTLNTCIHLFFAKVHAVFPIVHRATFRPSKARANLIIAMCTFGSLFTGSNQGLQQGLHFFERIQKASLQNWETSMRKSREKMISIIHCASLTQVFGMMSGSAQTLLNVNAFHGPPIAWARHLNLHRPRACIPFDPLAYDIHLDDQWRKWAEDQEISRMTQALYIVDAELSSLLHHEPIQSFESYSFSQSCCESVFNAPDALVWKQRYLAERHQRGNLPDVLDDHNLLSESSGLSQVSTTSRFTAYAVLEGISIRVLSKRRSSVATVPASRNFDGILVEFYHQFLEPAEQGPRCDPLQLEVLWHLVFMETCADFNVLEISIGREGYPPTPSELSVTTAWAASRDAYRCILHGLMIQKHVQAMTLRSELAIHVPRALFWFGLALICYIRFGSPSSLFHEPLRLGDFHFPELALIGVDESELVAELTRSGVDDHLSQKTVFFSIIDLLEHAGHWEIARRFAAILRTTGNFVFDGLHCKS